MNQPGENDRTWAADQLTGEFVPSRDVTQCALGDDRSSTTLPGAEAANGGPTVAGYEILGVVGRGGMGVVYKARHVGLNRVVALKMILGGSHASPQDRSRFRMEAEAVARLTHPNIVQIHDIGEADGNPYFSLEFIDGGSLAQQLDGTPQPANNAAALVEKLARAIHSAHVQGIVHRDLKPANVLLQKDEGTRLNGPIDSSLSLPPSAFSAKITDFGLAKKLDDASGQTQSGAIVGTPSYMAPEQAAGKGQAIGPATDVYALGAILFELLTGRPPFKGETPMDTILQVIDKEPLPPTQLNPRVPRDLDTITLKCLQKSPAKRYTSANELAEDLRRFQAGEPILARPVSTLERVGKWVRRRPAVAALSASLLVVAIVAFVMIALALDRERDERAKAQESEKDAKIKAALAHEAEERARKEKVQADNLRIRAEKGEREATTQRDKTAEAERRARDGLWHALLAQAQAGRWSGRPGRRFDSLDALAKAAAMRPDLRLRNEAIACMTLADVHDGKEWEGCPDGTFCINFDRSYERYARSDDKGAISIRRVADDREIHVLPSLGCRTGEMQFDPTGQYLAVAYRERMPMIMRIWDVSEGAKVFEQPLGPWDFSPDGKKFAIAFSGGLIKMFAFPSGTQEWQLTGPGTPEQVRFSPQGDKLAISGGVGIQIRDAASGKLSRTLTAPRILRGISWHPDGKLLAAGCGDNRVHIWHEANGVKKSILEGHNHQVIGVIFNHDGALLSSTSWDGTVRVWDVVNSKPVVTLPPAGPFTGALFYVRYTSERYMGFRTVGTKIKLLEVATGKECRILFDQLRTPRAWRIGIHADERLLTTPEMAGTGLWDLATGKKIGTLPPGNSLATGFQPDGNALVTYTSSGTQRWPVSSDAKSGTLQIGPPEPIEFDDPTSFVHVSPDAKLLSLFIPSAVAIFDIAARKKKFTLSHPAGSFVGYSPDGKWIATGTWHGNDIMIWNASNGKLTKRLPMRATAGPLFSACGKWLLVRARDYQLYEVGTWTLRHTITREQETDVPGGAAFSADGKVLALIMSPLAVRLIDLESKAELATLEAQDVNSHGDLHFSSTGRYLIRTDERLINQVWDLHSIRRRLADMGLDWSAKPLPAEPVAVDKPLEVKIDPGKLKFGPDIGLTPEEQWDRTLKARLATVKKTPKNALANNNLAWHYLTGPESRRDPDKALPYAQIAFELQPNAHTSANTLGLAYYRVKEYRKAINVLEQNLSKNAKNFLLAYDLCFLAMCHHQLGESAKAKQRYDESLTSFEKNIGRYPEFNREELRSFHAEAAALLMPAPK